MEKFNDVWYRFEAISRLRVYIVKQQRLTSDEHQTAEVLSKTLNCLM